MRCWELADGFGTDHLRLVERPDPTPGPGQIALRMKAISLNYRDLLMVRGQYDPRLRFPLVPCSDGVGEVTAIGEGVTRFAVGDRVCPTFAQGWIAGDQGPETLKRTLGGPLDGTLAERMVVDAEGAVAVPAHLTDEEAACLPCAAVTAWRALVTRGGVRPGDTVLTLGTGGVSLFAVQIGRMLGARVIVTSSSAEKLERARALGADHGIDYVANPRWSREVQRLTDGRGADLVVELAGGTLGESLRAVRSDGTIALIGVLSGTAVEVPLTAILMRSIRVQGVFVGDRQDFEALTRALAAHPEVWPVVHRVWSFDEAPAAIEALARGEHMGKLVIRA